MNLHADAVREAAAALRHAPTGPGMHAALTVLLSEALLPATSLAALKRALERRLEAN